MCFKKLKRMALSLGGFYEQLISNSYGVHNWASGPLNQIWKLKLSSFLPLQNTALSALLTVCNSAGDALDIRQQTTVIQVVGQLWAFISIQQVRKATHHFFKNYRIFLTREYQNIPVD